MPLLSKALMTSALSSVKSANASRFLREVKSKALASDARFDIFLSHSYSDAEVISLIYQSLTAFGFSVFVDWIEADHLDRLNVTRETADTLRQAISRCDCLLYAETPNARESKWMPWELGYADALHERVAVMPIPEEESSTEEYVGREYLGLYPYVTINRRLAGEITFLVNESLQTFSTLEEWMSSGSLKKHGLFTAELRSRGYQF